MDENAFQWGTEAVRSGGPIPFLQYSPRRRHVGEFFLDAERWGDRVHLVHGRRRLTFGDLFGADSRAEVPIVGRILAR